MSIFLSTILSLLLGLSISCLVSFIFYIWMSGRYTFIDKKISKLKNTKFLDTTGHLHISELRKCFLQESGFVRHFYSNKKLIEVDANYEDYRKVYIIVFDYMLFGLIERHKETYYCKNYYEVIESLKKENFDLVTTEEDEVRFILEGFEFKRS